MVEGMIINSSDIGSQILPSVFQELSKSFEPLMGILSAIGIAFVVYLVVLIIKGIMSIRTGMKITKIAQNVEQINEKMNSLVKKKNKK